VPARKIDITGKRFGKLTALEPVGRSADRSITWRCRCDCVNETIVSGSVLRLRSVRSTGKPAATLSCGCLRATHGHSRKQSERREEYQVWKLMRQRCLNPKHPRCLTGVGGELRCAIDGIALRTFLLTWVQGHPCTASTGSTMMATTHRRTVGGPPANVQNNNRRNSIAKVLGVLQRRSAGGDFSDAHMTARPQRNPRQVLSANIKLRRGPKGEAKIT